MLRIFINNILPVFSIILLGYILMGRKFIGPSFVQAANRLVFYVAVPAMLFHKVAQSSFSANFHAHAVWSVLGALFLMFGAAAAAVRFFRLEPPSRATFVHSAFHGNLGYMAYAIAYYAMGERVFAQTALLSSFLIVAQNTLAILVFVLYAPNRTAPPILSSSRITDLVRQIATNPIILSVVAGVVCSYLRVPIPEPLSRSLDILSGMALPLALLLIGTSFSFGAARKLLPLTVGIGALKLVALPLIGWGFLVWWNVPNTFRLPALILLAAPPATITYIMASEAGGDTELAATVVSVLTLLSGVSYAILLSWIG